MRIGMHVEHHPTGRYLGVIVDLRSRAIVRITPPDGPDLMATPHEIRPATHIPKEPTMPITKDRPRG